MQLYFCDCSESYKCSTISFPGEYKETMLVFSRLAEKKRQYTGDPSWNKELEGAQSAGWKM